MRKAEPHNKLMDDNSFIKLYNAGLSDKKIALKFNISKTAVRLRRCKFGLTANFEASNPCQKTCSPKELIEYRKKGCYMQRTKRACERYKNDEEFRKRDNQKCKNFYNKDKRRKEKRKKQMREYAKKRRITP